MSLAGSSARRQGARCLVLVTLFATGVAGAADPFYEQVLRQGTDAYADHRFVDAEKALRSAAFGLLDEPARRAEALVYLALAQAGLVAEARFAETFGLLVECDNRFDAYAGAQIPPEHRAAFEAEVAHRASRLEALGPAAAAWLASLPARKVARLAPAPRRKELERLLGQEPQQAIWQVMMAELDLAEGSAPSAAGHATKALALAPADGRALRARGLARAASASWLEARGDLEACGLAVVDPAVAAALLRAYSELHDSQAASRLASTLAPSVLKDDAVAGAIAASATAAGDLPRAPAPTAPDRSEGASPRAGAAPTSAPAAGSEWPEGHTGPVAPRNPGSIDPGAGLWAQAAAVPRADHAAGVRERLLALGIPAGRIAVLPGADGLFRVRVGPLHDRDEARSYLAKLRGGGFGDAFLVNQ